MEWIADPTAWAGLATLIVLEIVLGIDNLIFIAILADKLPPEQRARARYVGLSLALFMRLGLLASISWVVTLTQPLVEVFGWSLSGRDLILLVGGLFLLFKATMELHERLEGHEARSETRVQHAVFWQVIVQIVVLDAVFSLDSVITAVGMVDHLVVMMIAVVVAVGVMMLAAKRLMDFVSAHPTVVILCLGFLMMIGFSLVAEGFGFHIPKGYLYAAIGFSVLIEMFNQFAHRNRKRLVRSSDLRERTAGAVLRMLGGSGRSAHAADEVAALVEQQEAGQIFAPEERSMIQGVLDLGDRPARSIMTPRPELSWLDVDTPAEEIERKILDQSHSRLLLARGSLDDLLGVALANDLLRDIAVGGAINLERSCRAPLIVHEGLNVLRLMERLRASPVQLAVVLDEYGSIEGVVTPADLLEAIAGEFPEEGEEAASLERAADGSWTVDASTDIRHLSGLIGVDLVDDDDKYSTLAGYLLWRLGRLPAVGERVQDPGFSFEIVSMQGRRIDQVRIRPSETEDALDARAEAGRRR